MWEVSFSTNRPNSPGMLYWSGGANAYTVKTWANHFKDATTFTDPYPEGAVANLTIKYGDDEHVIFRRSGYVLPEFHQFRRDVLEFARTDPKFRRNRSRRPFYMMVHLQPHA